MLSLADLASACLSDRKGFKDFVYSMLSILHLLLDSTVGRADLIHRRIMNELPFVVGGVHTGINTGMPC